MATDALTNPDRLKFSLDPKPDNRKPRHPAADWRDLRLSSRAGNASYNIDGLVKGFFAAQAPSLADRNQAGNYFASLIDGLSYTEET